MKKRIFGIALVTAVLFGSFSFKTEKAEAYLGPLYDLNICVSLEGVSAGCMKPVPAGPCPTIVMCPKPGNNN